MVVLVWNFWSRHVCIGKHNVGRQVCQHFGPISFTKTKFYSDSFSTKKHSLDYYHCIIWLYYCLALLYIIAPCFHLSACLFICLKLIVNLSFCLFVCLKLFVSQRVWYSIQSKLAAQGGRFASFENFHT